VEPSEELTSTVTATEPIFTVASALPPVVYFVNLTVVNVDTNEEITDFSYLVNEDNTGTAFDGPANQPSYKPMASYSPIVAAGDETTAGNIGLPDIAPSIYNPIADQVDRYFISVRAPGFKSWGQHVRFLDPAEEGTTRNVTIELIPEPLPLSSLRVFVFRDFAPLDGTPNFPVETGGEAGFQGGLAGFHVVLHDTVGEVVVDWEGNPICSFNPNFVGQQPQNENADCITDANGEVFIEGIPYGKYDVFVIPPNGSDWVQTTTLEGTKALDAWLEEGTDGRGAPNEILVEPGVPTAFWYGFARGMDWDDPANASLPPSTGGSIEGTIRNLVPFPPFEQLTFGEPVYRPWIALTDIGRTDQQVYRTRGDENGNFFIPDVPPGTYQLTIWDEPLDYIIAFRTVTVDSDPVDIDQVDFNGEEGTGIFRWFGWVSGYIYADTGVTAAGDPIPGAVPGNAIRDCLPGADFFDDVDDCEYGFAGAELVTKFRDGSIQQATFTDGTVRPGFYELPENRGPLGKFVNVEVDFGRYARTGHSVHAEQDSLFNQASAVADRTVVDPDAGGGLILSQETWEGRRTLLDWGKLPYQADNPNTPEYDGENGGISGVLLYATTRNEFEARIQAAEDYEPGIPNVMIRLWGLGGDGLPNTPDDELLNEVLTDSWQDPGIENPDNPVVCDVLDREGNPLPGVTPQLVAERCLEVPQLGNETKPGAYDGGWAFEDVCQTGLTLADVGITDDPQLTGVEFCEGPIPPGDYVIEVVEPHFYQVVKEEDNNTAEGHELEFVPQPEFVPPPCVGDLHTVGADDPNFAATYPGSPFIGDPMPLCNKRLVTLQDQQNAGVEIFLFTDTANVNHDPSLAGREWTSPEAVPPPGRFYGLVEDDLRLNLDPNSINYGEPKGIPGLPVTIRDFRFRVLTTIYTDENGYYEVMLPSSPQSDCPIPGGQCPAMYIVIPNDPGDAAVPNQGFSQDYIIDPVAFELFPGKMRWTDTPVDPLNVLVCSLPPETPQLFQVSTPVVDAGVDTDITLIGTRFATTLIPTTPLPTYDTNPPAPTVTLIDESGGETDLAVVTWTPATPFGPDLTLNTADDPAAVFEDVVVVTVPGSLAGGPYQLQITNNSATSGLTSVNGLTIHLTGGGYPAGGVLTVPAPANPDDRVIQDTIDSAPVGALIVIPPGTYRENVIVDRRVKLQGHGPGGAVGTGNIEVIDCPFPADPADVCPPPTLGGEEPFAHILGSVIDARFYTFDVERRQDWAASLPGTVQGPATVPGGAGVTVVAVGAADFDDGSAFGRAAIDGLGISGARGEGGGGIYAHAFVRNLQISNNILEVNSGRYGGAIALGQPLPEGLANNENDNAYIHHNRILSNGGLFRAGGVGIFNGADNYEFSNNDVCGNFSVEYGGGVSHFGLSPNANIHDNQIYFNESFDEGGGLMISGDPGATPDGLGLGSGPVNIEDNWFHLNVAGDDGGGIRLLDVLASTITIVNNIVANNVAGDFGGGLALDTASDVYIVNNTIVGNASTHTAEDSVLGEAHAAGIASELHSDLFIPPDGSTFSDPVLFNNILWDNLAYRWDNPPPTEGDEEAGFRLIPTAYIDLEVVDFDNTNGNCLDPTYSFLSVDYGPDGGACTTTDPTANNIISGALDLQGGFTIDPVFIRRMAAARIEIQVIPNRLNLNELVLFVDRKEGTFVGDVDFHILSASPVIDQGIDEDPRGSGFLAPCDDYDDDLRPNNALWDMGADELPGAPPGDVPCVTGPSNQPPVVEAGEEQSIFSLTTSLAGTVTDPENDPITFIWTYLGCVECPPQTIVTISDPNVLTPTVTFSAAGGEHRFRLTASDPFNPPQWDEVVVFVLTTPPVPAAAVYISLDLPGSYVIGGLPGVSNSDIIGCDLGPPGTCIMVFDGSSVGVGGVDVDAFEIINEDNNTGILMSFRTATMIDLDGDLTPDPVDDSDIVLFTPTSFGPATTLGTFSMYLRGIDVGLTTNGENVDALHVLEDGSLLISTAGNARVRAVPTETGLGTVFAADEDLLIYRPGTNTWALYFDGSDIGLNTDAPPRNEDIDGVMVAENGDIYLTTVGPFSVGSISGADEDVFICQAPTLTEGTTGANTTSACGSFSLYFDGSSTFGINNAQNGRDVDGIALGIVN
jgi:hypothetical protein